VSGMLPMAMSGVKAKGCEECLEVLNEREELTEDSPTFKVEYERATKKSPPVETISCWARLGA
jgi:hypothetical protein